MIKGRAGWGTLFPEERLRSTIYFICPRDAEGHNAMVPFSNSWLILRFICAMQVEKKDAKVLLKIVASEVCALPQVCVAVQFPVACDLLISLFLAGTRLCVPSHP